MKYRAVIETIEIDPDTGEKIGDAKINTIEHFIEAQTAYGGDVGLKLYINYKTMQSGNRLEDSGTYIKSIALDNIYASKRNRNVPVKFRHKYVWNTL